MVVQNWLISVEGIPARAAELHVATYPNAGEHNAYQDTVVKVTFSEPVRGIDNRSFVLTDSRGVQVPAWVDQIGAGSWGLFPNSIRLKNGETYIARLKAGICSLANSCLTRDTVWKFSVSSDPQKGVGDSSIPIGFAPPMSGLRVNSTSAPRAVVRDKPNGGQGTPASSSPSLVASRPIAH